MLLRPPRASFSCLWVGALTAGAPPQALPLFAPVQNEWRALGVQQSRGWCHYTIHKPEPHIMLFRRPKGYPNHVQPAAGQAAGLMVQ